MKLTDEELEAIPKIIPYPQVGTEQLLSMVVELQRLRKVNKMHEETHQENSAFCFTQQKEIERLREKNRDLRDDNRVLRLANQLHKQDEERLRRIEEAALNVLDDAFVKARLSEANIMALRSACHAAKEAN